MWALKWDGENRLIEATNVANVPNAGKQKLTFAYDHLGRRVRKTVYPWSGSNYSTTPSADLVFVYDGWNLVAELNATNKTVLRSYTWGSDLSGDMESAGGIGGLVLQRDHTGGGSHHFVGYDGNGNVTALISGADSAVTAVYEHGPFGEPIRASGTQAKANPFRWSTKFTDGETDLVYYGYRYYSASTGRWINRDPIAEDGGINLYAFVLNRPINGVDPLGNDLFSTAAEILAHHLQMMNNFQVGSKQWMNLYSAAQRQLYPMLLRGAAVYSGPVSIVAGIFAGATTVTEAFAVAPVATAVGVGGTVVGVGAAGFAIGYGIGTFGVAAAEYYEAQSAWINFQAEIMIEWWSSPDAF